jgi:anti-sigma regulatory factor (Ser/Thr protein kinase)
MLKVQQELLMSSERLSADKSSATQWKIEKIISDHHIEIRIIPESGYNANEAVDVASVRKLALSVLKQMGVTRRLDEIALVVDEFATNCVEHGDGIQEVDLGIQAEDLRVRTVNRIRPEGARLVSSEQRGQLVNELANDEAEDGRGMMLTEALADEWNQFPEGDTIITYADFCDVRPDDDALPSSKAA